MSSINKVPGSAGAEWLLAGFALLRKAPVKLPMLVVYWLVASQLLVALFALTGSINLIIVVQMALFAATPVWFGGLMWAAREAEAGRNVHASLLLQPVRDGRARALLAMILPSILLILLMAVLAYVLIGAQELQHLADVIEKIQAIAAAGGEPDPALMQDLPAGRILLWLLCVFVSGVVAAWCTFIATPQIVFQGADGYSAMRDSLRACLRNWPAMLLFYLLWGIAFFGITMILFVFVSFLQFVTGPAIALSLWNLVFVCVTVPTMAGAMLAAWRQMLLPPEAASTPGAAASPTTHFEA